jgi:hypothetical protein
MKIPGVRLIGPTLLLTAAGWLVWLVASVINTPDQHLSPQAERILSAPASLPPIDEHNAYFAVLGFYAAAGQDIHASGLAYWVKATDPRPSQRGNAPSGLAIPTLPDCQQRPGCLREQARKADSTEQILALERYRQLWTYPSFATVEADSATAPRALLAGLPHQLWLADTAWRILAGDARALSEVAANQRFWIMVALQTDDQASFLAAHAALQADYQLLADTAILHPLPQSNWAMAIERLPAKASDFSRVLNGEAYRLGWDLRELPQNWHRHPRQTASWLIASRAGRWFYQPKATVNLAMDEFERNAKQLSAPIQELAKLDDRCQPSTQSWRAAMANYSGQRIVCANLPRWRDAALQVRRSEALQRLLLAQQHLLQGGTLDQLPATTLNPFNGQAAHIEQGTLVFAWPDQPLRLALPH